jgi:predicted CXXCH cytochrome family protein
LLICSGFAAAQPTSVVNSPHNLSASGPSAVRAATEDQVCIFCHAPHNSSPVQPLWNRVMPTEAYTIYTSRALEAQPGQPTGNSKMCLSCHDGTIALGAVVSRTMPIVMSGGVTTIPEGHARIGTDLSDDHPISFRYDTSLAIKNPKLKDPALLPPQTRLDSNAELQCTSCHDAHNNSLGNFLVMRNDTSQLCTSCHQMGSTTVSGHAQCSACHQPHSAPSGPYLLRARNQTRTCLACHDGAHGTAQNIADDISKPYSHDTDSPVDPPGAFSEHTTCTSCHDPHTMGHGTAAPPAIHPNQGRIAGINVAGIAVSPASFEYETCFRCHGDANKVQPVVSRVILQNNLRYEFSTTAVSFHPVAGTGKNSDVPSLRPGYTSSSIIDCSSCHTSDTGPATAGSGPGGVHGSNRFGLLAANYTTADFTSESSTAYNLCYLCHDRTSILSNQSFSAHSKHIVDQRTSCATCHDSHGIGAAQGTPRNNSHLINFDITVVHADPTGRLEYVDKGMGSGQCTLSCHGTVHEAKQYQR